MKVHSMVNDKIADTIKDIAQAKGLGDINYDSYYFMYKIGQKISKDVIEMQVKTYVGNGCVCLIGNESLVALYLSNLQEWFKTSPVVSCKKNNDTFIIETENSFYELKERK